MSEANYLNAKYKSVSKTLERDIQSIGQNLYDDYSRLRAWSVV